MTLYIILITLIFLFLGILLLKEVWQNNSKNSHQIKHHGYTFRLQGQLYHFYQHREDLETVLIKEGYVCYTRPYKGQEADNNNHPYFGRDGLFGEIVACNINLK